MPQGTPEAPRFNLSVNGFRGFCALALFVYHVANSGMMHEPAGDLGAACFHVLTSLHYGVEMFFMISGFVILGSVRRHSSAGSFLRDRVLRIYPAWIPVLVSLFAVGTLTQWGPLRGVTSAEWLGLFVASLLFLPPVVPVPLVHYAAWSLCYEWVFYFVASTYRWLGLGKTSTRVLTLCWCVATLGFLVAFPRALFFAPGIVVILNLPRLRPHASWFRLAGVAMLAFLLLLRKASPELESSLLPMLGSTRALNLLLAAIVGTYMFAGIALGQGWLARVLQTRTFQFFGKISYSLYLWQGLFMHATKGAAYRFVVPSFGPTAGLLFFTTTSFAFSVLISWLSYEYCERRGAELLKLLIARRSEQQPHRAQS